MKVKSREILTPAQNAQEALDLARERERAAPGMKEVSGPENQQPTPDALAVLQNEAGRRKAVLSKQKSPVTPPRRHSKTG